MCKNTPKMPRNVCPSSSSLPAALLLTIALQLPILLGQTPINAENPISILAGGALTLPASPNDPRKIAARVDAIAFGPKGETYFSVASSDVVWINQPSGQARIFAGNGLRGFSGDEGQATSARLNSPTSLAVDSLGNVYIADSGNRRIRRVSSAGVITTIVGGQSDGFSGDSGPAIQARISQPAGIALDGTGNLYFADFFNGRIRKIDRNGQIQTIAGTTTPVSCNDPISNVDGVQAAAVRLGCVESLAIDKSGNLYFYEFNQYRIKRIGTDGRITLIAGNGGHGLADPEGLARNMPLGQVLGLTAALDGGVIFCEYDYNRLRRIDPNGTVRTVAGRNPPNDSTPNPGFEGDGGQATFARLSSPRAPVTSQSGRIFFSDLENNRVRSFAVDGTIQTEFGTGSYGLALTARSARDSSFGLIRGVVTDRDSVIFSDSNNNRIWRVTADGILQLVAGTGDAGFGGDLGPAVNARLNEPRGLTVDSRRNVYVADTRNNRVRRIAPDGVITTVAGTGIAGFDGDGKAAISAMLNGPTDVAWRSTGLLIADRFNNRIREAQIDFGSALIQTVVGNGSYGFSGDGGAATQASLKFPVAVASAIDGSFVIADSENGRIRIVDRSGVIRTIAGTERSVDNACGKPEDLSFCNLEDVAIDNQGTVFISDFSTGYVWSISAGLSGKDKAQLLTGRGECCGIQEGGPARLAGARYATALAVDDRSNLLTATGSDVLSGNQIRIILRDQPTILALPIILSMPDAPSGGSIVSGEINLSLFPNKGLVSFTASVKSSPSISGITPGFVLEPISGTIPGKLRVYVDPINLPRGFYQGTVTLVVPGARTLEIPIFLNVTLPIPSRVSVDGANEIVNREILLSSVISSAEVQKQITIQNLGTKDAVTVSTSISEGFGNWLIVDPPSRALSPGETASLTLRASPLGLQAGTYRRILVLRAFLPSGETQQFNLSVVLEITSGQQSLPKAQVALSQTGISFVSVAGGGRPLDADLAVLNVGSGDLNWTASVSTDSNWLVISPSSGNGLRPFLEAQFINLKVDPQGLAPGEYSATLRVMPIEAPLEVQIATIQLTVLKAGEDPGFEVQPAGLLFIGQNSTNGSQTFRLNNVTKEEFTLKLTQGSFSDDFGFTVNRPKLQLAPGTPEQIVVQPLAGPRAPGVYRGFVNVNSPSRARTVAVVAVVPPQQSQSDTAIVGRKATPTLSAPNTGNITIVFRQPVENFVARAGGSVTIEVATSDAKGNPVLPDGKISVRAVVQNTTSITMLHIGGGIWQCSWTPNGEFKQVKISVLVSSNQFSDPRGGVGDVSGQVTASGRPVISFQGVVNAASFGSALLAPGSLISIFGSSFAPALTSFSSFPLPETLGGIRVRVGERTIPLLNVGPNQVNAQLPFDLEPGRDQQIVVQADNILSAPETVPIVRAAPGIFGSLTLGAAAIFVNGAPVSNTNPLKLGGDPAVIWCTGLGQTIPGIPAGILAPQQPLATVPKVSVSIAGIDATVDYAGSAPGQIGGLYQVNFRLPLNMPLVSGPTFPLVLSVDGQRSKEVTVWVQ